jgi:diacylglycerol kinase family enzyme
MDNTDAVLVAGGDGTIMEAVTGGLWCRLFSLNLGRTTGLVQ